MLHDVTALLLVKGADPDARDEMGRTPLMNATRTGDVKSVQQLLKHEAEPNVATRKAKWTALMQAAHLGIRAAMGLPPAKAGISAGISREG